MAVVEHEQQTFTPAVSNPVAEVLNDAADLIERDGWFQLLTPWGGGTSHREGDLPRCAMVAIRQSEGGTGVFFEAIDALCTHIGATDTTLGAAMWNDAPGRTKGDVVAALRASALVASSR